MEISVAKDIIFSHIQVTESIELKQALIIAMNMIDKQLPKNPLLCDVDSRKLIDIDGCCPNCGFKQLKGDIAWKKSFNKYCINCGQALDWSGIEE